MPEVEMLSSGDAAAEGGLPGRGDPTVGPTQALARRGGQTADHFSAVP